MSDIKIHIVYFGYLNTDSKNWKNSHPQKLMIQQLNDLNDFGLAKAAKTINIVFTNPKESNFNNTAEKRADEIIATVEEILPTAKIHRTAGNKHEYPGIRLVYDIGMDTPKADAKNTLILYFHAKGITNTQNPGVRTNDNNRLTNSVIKPWNEIVERFKRDPALNKAGYAASAAGFIWFNFWWARASYIASCVTPILTERRHYYEDWVGRLHDNPSNPKLNRKPGEETGKFSGPGDCLSLCAGVNAPLGMGMAPGDIDKCTVKGGRRKTLKIKRERG